MSLETEIYSGDVILDPNLRDTVIWKTCRNWNKKAYPDLIVLLRP